MFYFLYCDTLNVSRTRVSDSVSYRLESSYIIFEFRRVFCILSGFPHEQHATLNAANSPFFFLNEQLCFLHLLVLCLFASGTVVELSGPWHQPLLQSGARLVLGD